MIQYIFQNPYGSLKSAPHGRPDHVPAGGAVRDLPLVRSIAQRVAVMNRGRIVELGSVDTVLVQPKDAYTQALLSDTPSLEAVTA